MASLILICFIGSVGRCPVAASNIVSEPRPAGIANPAPAPFETSDGAEVSLSVETASLETDNRMRKWKMRKSHLDAQRFAKIRFRSTRIRVPVVDPGGAGEPLVAGEPRTALLEGLPSLHGIERKILFPVSIRYDDGCLTSERELGFRLSDHDIPIPRFLWMVLEDDVRARFRLTVGTPAEGVATAEPGEPGGGEDR